MSKKIWFFVGVDHAAITVTFLESESEVRLDIKFDSAETAVIIRTLVLHSSKKVSSSLLLCPKIRTNACGSDD